MSKSIYLEVPFSVHEHKYYYICIYIIKFLRDAGYIKSQYRYKTKRLFLTQNIMFPLVQHLTF